MESAKILIIEDNPAVLDCIQAVLELHDFDVLCAEDGASGLEMIRRHRPSVIISDYDMPGMNGIQVLEQVRRLPDFAEVPFIIFTAHGTRSVREHCFLSGANEVLDKGSDAERFVEAILQTLGKRVS